jgi:RNA polymerase primary sigma factor
MTDDTGLNRFLAEAAQHRLLTAKEERTLGRKVQAGIKEGETPILTASARAARNELVRCNVRLVVSVARYYRGRGLPMEDVIQNGILGLNRAAEKYDPTRDIRFSTYATLWIKQAIQRGFTSGSTAIRVPSTVAAARAKVRAAMLRYPDADMTFLADFCDLDVGEVERALEAAEVVTSLDRAIGGEADAHTLLDSLADPHGIDPHADDVHDHRVLYDALAGLERDASLDHRRIIEMTFGFEGNPPMKAEDIAKKVKHREGARRGSPVSTNLVKTMRDEALDYLGHRLGKPAADLDFWLAVEAAAPDESTC